MLSTLAYNTASPVMKASNELEQVMNIFNGLEKP